MDRWPTGVITTVRTLNIQEHSGYRCFTGRVQRSRTGRWFTGVIPTVRTLNIQERSGYRYFTGRVQRSRIGRWLTERG